MKVKFKINPSPTFSSTVEIPVSGDSGETQPLPLVFRHRKVTEIDMLTLEAQQTRSPEDTAQFLAREIVAGFQPGAVVDENGEDVPFSAEALFTILDNYPAAGACIWVDYNRAIVGARSGN